MLINNNFEMGQIVYLKTDTLQLPRIIVAIQVTADGGLLYRLCQGIEVDWHYEVEMSAEKDVILTSTN